MIYISCKSCGTMVEEAETIHGFCLHCLNQQAKARERRERLAATILAGYYAGSARDWDKIMNAVDAIAAADALITELDREQPQEVEP